MRAPMCATSCATPPRRRCRGRSRPPSTARRATARSAASTTSPSGRGVREIEGRGEVRGVEMLVGGGTSIMPRVAPVLYDFVELDNGDYLKITEAVLQDLRPPGVAARQPRTRADQGVRRQVRHRRAAQAGRGGAQGRVGQGKRLLDRAATVPRRRARVRARAPPPATGLPTATSVSSSASGRPMWPSRSKRAS